MLYEVITLQAALMRLMPKPLLTRDQVLMMMRDNVASGNFPGFAELGIEPTTVETIVPTYLNRFRRNHRQVITRTV